MILLINLKICISWVSTYENYNSQQKFHNSSSSSSDEPTVKLTPLANNIPQLLLLLGQVFTRMTLLSRLQVILYRLWRVYDRNKRNAIRQRTRNFCCRLPSRQGGSSFTIYRGLRPSLYCQTYDSLPIIVFSVWKKHLLIDTIKFAKLIFAQLWALENQLAEIIAA